MYNIVSLRQIVKPMVRCLAPYSHASFSLAITVLPAKSDSDVMFCLQSFHGLIIDRSLVYKSYPHDRIYTHVI